ncbi:RDD family protein [Oleiharenicola lentus]|uniref:RDD family protein n=1 Tax=Oleiharenicola lentus TaxID=2508720 RepID=UPI003F6707AB
MNADQVELLRVRTPEGVSFSFMLASPIPRFAAWIVDQAAILAAWSVLSTLLALMGALSSDFAQGAMFVGFFVLTTGYAIVLEWSWNGQTVGKRLLRLRVMDERGLPLRFSQVVVRNLLRPVDALPFGYLTGGVVALIGKKAQRLGDVAGATVVVHEPLPGGAGMGGLAVSKYNSLRGQRHLTARLRANISPALAQAALQALVRREQFAPEARLELFGELAAYFRSLSAMPPEFSEGISDEQLVRNVVEAVFDFRETKL